MELASVALAARIPYVGADFRLDPPEEGPPLPVPTLAVIGTGKRTGKTAIAGTVARLAARRGLEPVVVAMGRGGPPEPTLAPAGSIDLAHLVRLVAEGEHAASDYLEDAVTTGVTTVGRGAPAADSPARRTPPRPGGRRPRGLHPSWARHRGGVRVGVPPVPWDAAVLVVPATAPAEYLRGYLGPYRLLRSDLVVVTMASDPSGPKPFRAPFPCSALPERCGVHRDELRSGAAGRDGARKRSSLRLHLLRSSRSMGRLEAIVGAPSWVGARGWRIAPAWSKTSMPSRDTTSSSRS